MSEQEKTDRSDHKNSDRNNDPTQAADVDRRGFLKGAGFGLATTALAGCTRGPVETAIPYLNQPEGLVAGRADWYASSCAGCSAGCGLLVKTREGRPIKLEGNPDHPVSGGGLCAVGQAGLVGVYDSYRLKQPLANGQPTTWGDADQRVIAALDDAETKGLKVRVLTGTINGPTERFFLDKFLGRFQDARHIIYDALSSSAILEAHERSHGKRLLPRYLFDRAHTIASFGADFLGTWISPVEFSAGYSAGRSLHGTPPKLSHHTQFESRMSLSGANADERFATAPGQTGVLLSWLATELAKRAEVALTLQVTPAEAALGTLAPGMTALADRLWHSKGHALVISDSQQVDDQLLCNWINQILDGYGHTLDLETPSYQRLGDDQALELLLGEIERGEVDVLITSGVNPVYDLPNGVALASALERVPRMITVTQRSDETSALAQVVCPAAHELESWADAEPVAGAITLTQPVINKIYDSRTFVECLAAWIDRAVIGGTLTGGTLTDGTLTDGTVIDGAVIDDAVATGELPAHERLKQVWATSVHSRSSSGQDFETFWEHAVHDGFVKVAQQETKADFNQSSQPSGSAETKPGGFSLVLYPKVGQLDGRHAHNPWLQELPDPITKVCWDNYACLSPEAAENIGAQTGDLVRLEVGGESIELPALIQIGQHPQAVAVALGYGRLGTDRFTDVGPKWLEGRPTVDQGGTVGTRASGLSSFVAGQRSFVRSGVTMTKTSGFHGLALTQTTASLTPDGFRAPVDGTPRPFVQETAIGAYIKDPTAGTPATHHFDSDLWPEHESTGHRWGLAVDLNACTGCSACVIACQAENNVPVVGRDEVFRRREMHWMRIDRYYDEHGTTSFQPMMCQQCDNAPCETVCPVAATVHSDEGLNQQVYNRCVGTRYCANNCPYKVRRFNWFNYSHNDLIENLALNPDVVVRTRGVMEKCTFCVQRIQSGKISAKVKGQELSDGDIQSACQQSCPAGAIVFGDLNDPESEVSKMGESGRNFKVLEELNVKPSVGYLRRVRNREAEARAEDGAETALEENAHG